MRYIYLSLTCFVGLVLWLQCTPSPADAPTSLVVQGFRQDLQSLDTKLGELENILTQANPSAWQEAFGSARLAYKRTEYLVETQYPESAKALNGAAIAEMDAQDTTKTIAPTGFQVIEEWLFPEADPTQQKALQQELATMRQTVAELIQHSQQLTLTESQILDAARLQVFRVITLGIVGFDSPVALYSLPEAKASLEAVQAAVLALAKSQNSTEKDLLAKAFTQTVAYLDQHLADFDAFDRMAFIRTHINPLTTALWEYQVALDIPFPTDKRMLRADVKTLFDVQAFDPNYFAPGQLAQLSPEKAALGKMLFFDPILSSDNERSCASCHQPDKAFTDGIAKSVAFGKKGHIGRNSPTLVNAAFQANQFYDGRVETLEQQAADVLANIDEMHSSAEAAAAKLAKVPAYVALFAKAFPEAKQPVTAENVQIALASFTRQLSSFDSRFDRYLRQEQGAALSPEELLGFNLYMGKAKCATCHFMPLFNGTVPPNFTETEAEVIGVPLVAVTSKAVIDPDVGKQAIAPGFLNQFAFRTPTVRNSGLTAPYMHNGAYETLEAVMEFYNLGGGAGIGIDLPHQTLPTEPLNLNERELKALVAFMHTLTDVPAFGKAPEKLPTAQAPVIAY
ncbi:cytochrome c peroxidase [Eisenibacter elegans]|jgi:cytochrome c peroxidase|uniref:cytochrome c peroxidase n=1 Tax=Eisenibacter elegans TaxID=997 RepID=UPI00040511C8|nr:cytochrome c peroxidase [Eisenibacter elegans]